MTNHATSILRREYLSLAGLRQDGRRPHEWRPTSLQLGVFGKADGSASLSIANTKVLAAVYGPKARTAPPATSSVHGCSVVGDAARTLTVRCSITVAAFSRQQHRIQHVNDRRTASLSMLVENTFRSSLFCHALPSSEIEIHVQVLEDDGGLESAVCNAISAALVDAHVPMRDTVVAASVSILQQTVLVDPTREELSASSADVFYCTNAHSPDDVLTMNVHRRLTKEDMEILLQSASGACVSFYESIQTLLRERVDAKFRHLQFGIVNIGEDGCEEESESI